jgi:peptidoglycan/LPS O-acetylase OafA/YrhL
VTIVADPPQADPVDEPTPVVLDVTERGDADPPASTPGGTDLEFRPDVEGLRAVAIILVVLYHSGVSWMSGGFVGVDVFFVISGFLITGLLLREHEKRGRISIPGFYARRSRRILPAAMLVVLVTILIAHGAQNFFDYSNTAQAGTWASLFAANIHFANIGTNYFAQGNTAPSPLLTYWSLAVEEQFYLVWPWLVVVFAFLTTQLVRHVPVQPSVLSVVRRLPVKLVVLVVALAVTIASFIWSMHANNDNATWAYFSPFTRGWELGVGAIAACIVGYLSKLNKWVGVVLAWGGMAAILVSACDLNVSVGVNVFPPTRALVPVLGAVAIILGGASGLGAGWFLGYHPIASETPLARAWARYQRANPMRLIGRVSYGWYLLHYPPMILFAGTLWQGPIPVHDRLYIAIVTLGISFLMYYLMERPIRRSSYLASRPWVSIMMGLSCVAAAFCVCELYHLGFSY